MIATSDHRPAKEAITALLPRYTGEIEQTPPAYSAVKINGQRAYDIARGGATPDVKTAHRHHSQSLRYWMRAQMRQILK